MKYTLINIVFLFIILPFGLMSQIANGYSADIGIGTNTNVIFTEMFEQPDTYSLIAQSGYTASSVLTNISFDPSVPPGSTGSQSCKLRTVETSTTLNDANEDTYLLKKFSTGINDSVFVRYYIKYNNAHAFHHSGVWMGGNYPASCWPCSPSGKVPSGDSAFKIGTEIQRNMTPQNNGKFGFYNYFKNMTVTSTTPPNWGNEFISPNPNALINMSQWNCIEVMIKLNVNMTDSTGELALWINGNKIAHYGKGFPLGTWNSLSFNEGTGNPFKGFLFRTNPSLMFNYIWIKNYSTDNTAYPGQNDILFDHIVVAKKYIGPINISTGIPTSDRKESSFDLFPSPTNDLLHFSEELKSLEIYNALGQKVLSKNTPTKLISVESLKSGVYFLHANNYVKKFIVE